MNRGSCRRSIPKGSFPGKRCVRWGSTVGRRIRIERVDLAVGASLGFEANGLVRLGTLEDILVVWGLGAGTSDSMNLLANFYKRKLVSGHGIGVGLSEIPFG